jgi:hypothetical protein
MNTILTKDTITHSTLKIIESCKHCTEVCMDNDTRTPVHCTKFAGSSMPIHVNIAACMTCSEYHKIKKMKSMLQQS